MKDTFGKTTVRLNAYQATVMLELIENNVEFEKMPVGEVLDMNALTLQLKWIIENDR